MTYVGSGRHRRWRRRGMINEEKTDGTPIVSLSPRLRARYDRRVLPGSSENGHVRLGHRRPDRTRSALGGRFDGPHESCP